MCEDEDVDVTQVASEEDMVEAVVNSGAHEDSVFDETGEEGPSEATYLGSIHEQLSSVARVKGIVAARGSDDGALMRGLRRLQDALRIEKGQGMRQTRIDNFFK